MAHDPASSRFGLRYGQCAGRSARVVGGKGILEADERKVDGPSRKRKQIRGHMSLLASGQFGRTVSDYDNWIGAQRRSSWRFGCLPWFKANDGR
jgi:hypothetical protein